ncbi:MAG: DNA methylase [Clostridia bacterium]|nr:DNA methylase [Clostridia bacterium]
MKGKAYIAIDLKSFYASVECVERGLDPLTANLVVADESRSEKTICLAVTPSLKSLGIPGRARLFEVVEKVREINAVRRKALCGGKFSGSSVHSGELAADPSLAVDYLIAKPRMSLYMETSARIYDIYLRYVSAEDMHVYSVDEVFIDATHYLSTYGLTAKEFAEMLVQTVFSETGITATAGIGTNLYLCKIAMDIVAKHMAANENGLRIAELDEQTYRRTLWAHRPITDFWRVGGGSAKRLASCGLYTMGDIALQSHRNEALLYRLFGVNAELLIDHAWGVEPCTIADIKAYRPENNSLSVGQVLSQPYDFKKAKLIVKEMTDSLVLDLVEKQLVTNQIVLTVGYDTGNVTADFRGESKTDRYGRTVPKEAHGSENIGVYTSSTRLILDVVSRLYDRLIKPDYTVRRMYVVANHVIRAQDVPDGTPFEQMSLFVDYAAREKAQKETSLFLEKEHRMQETLLEIRRRYGKNAILKGMNLEEGATQRERNGMVGGHKG